MKAKIFLVFGLLIVGVVSAVVHLPAALVAQFVPLPANLKLNGVSGTIWRGEIDSLQVESLGLGKVVWKVEPAALLKGQLRAQFRFGEQSAIHARGKGTLSASTGVIALQQLSVSLPAKSLSPWIKTPLPVALDGNVSLFVTEYQFAGKLFCQSLNGQLSWQQASVEVMANQLDLGEAGADLSCQNQQVVAKTIQQSGQVSSEFTLSLRTPNRFTLNGWLKPESGLAEPFRQQLQWLGSPDTQNRYQIKQNGRW